PKSIATVVEVLRSSFDRSSTPSEYDVIVASVVSGSISEMAPTSVVLPTPNPPAIRNFTGCGPPPDPTKGSAAPSECSYCIDHPQQECRRRRRRRLVDSDQPGVRQVPHEDLGDPQRDGDALRDPGDGAGSLAAVEVRRVLALQRSGRWGAGALDQRLDPEVDRGVA